MLFKPEYKVKLNNKICWKALSSNINAIPIIEKNLDKVTPTKKKNETKRSYYLYIL